MARATNAVQQILESGKYDGAIWTEGSPRIEETIYWLNLLIDTTVPICGNAAQRPHGMISNDGPKNIVDSVVYIASRVWVIDRGTIAEEGPPAQVVDRPATEIAREFFSRIRRSST